MIMENMMETDYKVPLEDICELIVSKDRFACTSSLGLLWLGRGLDGVDRAGRHGRGLLGGVAPDRDGCDDAARAGGRRRCAAEGV